jgi:hypothetical protein
MLYVITRAVMVNKVKHLDLEEAVAGMVLSKAIADGQGGILLPDSTVLTDAMLTSLRRRCIDQIDVVNNDISDADLEAERERVQQRMAILFRKCGMSPACGLLEQRIIEYRLGRNE